jgi:hypothetical protein
MWELENALWQWNVLVSIFFIISHIFTLGVVITKMNDTQKSWTSQIIKNAKNVERCTGNLYVKYASKSFNIY